MVLLVTLATPRLELAERWAFAMPSRGTISNQGALEVLGERAFYLETSVNDNGGVGCLDLRTGRPRWHLASGKTGAGRLVVGGGHLVVKRNESVVELDPATGRTVWTLPVERYHLGPLVVGETLVAETKAGALRAYDLRTHRLAWRLDYPAEFRGCTRNGAAAVGGGALWAEAADGRVLKIALKNGHLLFKRPSGVEKPYAIVPMGARVAVLGYDATAVWRSADGAVAWRQDTGYEGGGFYAAARDELWRAGIGEFEMLRYRAADGARVRPSVSLERPYIGLGSPVPWDSGYLMATSQGLEKLDAQGKIMGEYDAGEGFTQVVPLGADVLARSDDRIVRLRSGLPPVPRDPAAEARRLVRKASLSTTERIALRRLGRAAVPTILAALRGSAAKDKASLEWVLFDVADARDTAALFPLAERTKTFGGESGLDNMDYRDWMEHKADPEWLAPRLLPRLRAARDDETRRRLVDMLRRSRNPAVVGEFLRLLRLSTTRDWVKGEIYHDLARSERPEALAFVRATRAGGRRLARPTAGLSLTADADGDGIPDAYDANPWVAPRALDERERLMAAAFDACFRFSGTEGRVTRIAYGPGVRPFELVGWSGALRPVVPDGWRKAGRDREGLSFDEFSADGEVVRMSEDGREATVRLARRMGYGTEERLRRIGGEWYVVEYRETWVN